MNQIPCAIFELVMTSNLTRLDFGLDFNTTPVVCQI